LNKEGNCVCSNPFVGLTLLEKFAIQIAKMITITAALATHKIMALVLGDLFCKLSIRLILT
jgi:hypothetical protein